jgi:hypothetical protein
MLQLRDEIKAAHDDADQARAERDKAVNESTVCLPTLLVVGCAVVCAVF